MPCLLSTCNHQIIDKHEFREEFGDDEEMMEACHLETQIMHTVKGHPNVIELIDVEDNDKYYCIIMPLAVKDLVRTMHFLWKFRKKRNLMGTFHRLPESRAVKDLVCLVYADVHATHTHVDGGSEPISHTPRKTPLF